MIRSAAMLLACLLATTQMTMLVSVAMGSDCEESCPDDGPGSSCCLCYTCARHLSPPLASLTARAVAPAVVGAARAAVALLPVSPDPDEILHVPKYALA